MPNIFSIHYKLYQKQWECILSYLKASNDGIPDKTAFLQTGSPSCDITRFL